LHILIEVPTWLGDAVMATPAIENILKKYPDSKLIIFGSFISTKLFLHHPNVEKIIVDTSKKNGNRYINLFNYAKDIKKIDIAISFRRSFSSKFFLFFVDAKEKYNYKRFDSTLTTHQVIRYNDFINRVLDQDFNPENLKIYTKNTPLKHNKPTLGINPGATYGSAKRWYPKEFAKVAIALSTRYDIKIFGGPQEQNIALDIEKELQEANITNYENLSGKTSVEELIEQIASLSLFITNDSGPMHIAAAFQIPTVTIFGPTRWNETHQWMNEKEMIVRKEMECSPCMKRVCPLKHHDCMRLITAEDVLQKLQLNKI